MGNVRLSYADTDDNGTIDAVTEIIEESNYYPFGLKHQGYNNLIIPNGNSVAQRIGFGNKELNKELGIEWIDFGARNYDATLGRWMNLDPLSEKYFDKSPYVYVFNSPLMFVDPDGMRVDLAQVLGAEGGLEAVVNLLMDLTEITGLSSLTISRDDDGGAYLEYGKGEDGKAQVTESNGVQLGSFKARKDLMNVIDDPSTLKVTADNSKDNQAVAGGIEFNMNLDILDRMNSANNSKLLYKKTMGIGMLFLHELGHTQFHNDGAGHRDVGNDDELGPNVIRMNNIREELDNNPLNMRISSGRQFGRRSTYFGSDTYNLGKYKYNKDFYLINSRLKFEITNKRGKKKIRSIRAYGLQGEL